MLGPILFMLNMLPLGENCINYPSNPIAHGLVKLQRCPKDVWGLCDIIFGSRVVIIVAFQT